MEQLMKQLLNLNILIFFTFLFSTCTRNKNFNYHDELIHESKILENNHVHKITETRVELDTLGNPDWKRIETIKFFNDKGLNVKLLTPRYIIEWTGGKAIKGKLFLSPRGSIHTYRYAGYTDTIYREYNRFSKLKKEIEISHEENGRLFSPVIYEYAYNNNGNLISTCRTLENLPISCLYMEYKYGDDGQIILRKDSSDYLPSGVTMSYEISKPFEYKYDDNRNLIFNGLNIFNLDEKGNVLDRIPTRISPNAGVKRKFDSQGNLIEELSTYFNLQEHKVMEQDEKTYYKYNDKNLIIEKKIISKNRIKRLFKYEYE